MVSLSLGFIIAVLPLQSVAQPIAEGKNKYLGNIIRDGNSIRSDFSKYWNQVTAENAGKWESVESIQDSYNWTQLTKIYEYALANHFPYKHHALVWGSQYPAWITGLDSAAQRAQVEEWIRLVGEKYPEMDFADVVNEPFNAPPPFLQALGGSGDTGWDWVITAFEWARQYCAPGVKLMLNEYNVLHSNSVTDDYIALIDTLKRRGLIDAIGIQGHYFEFRSPEGAQNPYVYSIDTIKDNLDRLAATGLPIYITEFDIDEADDQTQLESYKTYFPIFWEHPAVKGITLWGYVQYIIWKQNAYLLTERLAERPAMKWLQNYIASPPAPELISPDLVSDVPRNPILIWHTSPSAISYQVQVSNNSVFTSLFLDTTVTDTSLQLDTLAANTKYYWRVSASNEEGTSEYSDYARFTTGDHIVGIREFSKAAAEFWLFQNYPNPFNPATTIVFRLPQSSTVRLVLMNIIGEEIMTIASGHFNSGPHAVKLDAASLASGVYFYRLEAGNDVNVKKLLILK